MARERIRWTVGAASLETEAKGASDMIGSDWTRRWDEAVCPILASDRAVLWIAVVCGGDGEQCAAAGDGLGMVRPQNAYAVRDEVGAEAECAFKVACGARVLCMLLTAEEGVGVVGSQETVLVLDEGCHEVACGFVVAGFTGVVGMLPPVGADLGRVAAQDSLAVSDEDRVQITGSAGVTCCAGAFGVFLTADKHIGVVGPPRAFAAGDEVEVEIASGVRAGLMRSQVVRWSSSYAWAGRDR